MATKVEMPFQLFADPMKFGVIASGRVYVGEPSLDPTIEANQYQLIAVQGDGTSIPISQPIVLSVGGVPLYEGSPVEVTLAEETYSISVLTNLGAQVFYQASYTPSGAGAGAVPEAPNDGTMYGRIDSTWQRAVQLAGDIMSGALGIVMDNAKIFIQSASATDVSKFQINDSFGKSRAEVVFDESSGNVVLIRNSGNPTLQTSVTLSADGNVAVNGAAPVKDGDLARKDYVDAGLDTKMSKYIATQNIDNTPAYTLLLTDADNYIRFEHTADIVVTIPADVTVAFPIGSQVTVAQTGAGVLSVAGEVGVTVNTPDTLNMRKQFSVATLIKVSSDSWDLMGDLEV